jgi:type IV secretory pathway TraG/TraD family ATPase VirD4
MSKSVDIIKKSLAKPRGYKQQETYNDKKNKALKPILVCFFIAIAVWFYISATAAAYAKDFQISIFEALGHVTDAMMQSPVYGFVPNIAWAEFKYLFLIGLLAISALCLWLYAFDAGRAHHDVNTLKGSSEWANPEDLSSAYGEFKEVPVQGTLPFTKKTKKDFLLPYSNSILSQNFQMSLDTHINPKAVNTLILGTTGSGKSRYYLKPNLLQMNSSYVITDPSGGILQQCGETLRRHGYNVRIFDINNMGDCSTYNPMKYCYSEADVKKLVNAFIKNTAAPGSENSSKDPFWDDSMNAFLCAIVSLLVNYGMDPEIMGGKTYIPCFASLAELTRMANKPLEDNGKQPLAGRTRQPRGGDGPTSAKSALNVIFENVKKRAEEEGQTEMPYCLREWDNFKIAPEKTSTTILMTTAVRLDAFNIDKVRNLTTGPVVDGKPTDTICLDTFAEQKDALFVIIPTNDRTYNFLAAFLYTQLFDILYRKGEHSAGTTSVKLQNNDLVKWFDQTGVEKGNDKEFLEKIKNTQIEKVTVNGELEGTLGKGKNAKKVIVDDSYYEIKLADGTVISRRPTLKKAKAYQEALKKAKIVKGNGQALPNHVRFLLDEFPNIGEIPEFKEKLATIRKYEISVCVICQSITQLKGMYEKDYEVIDANCPETIFLGGDENSNNEYISKKLGKSTVVGANASINEKSSGSHSYNVEERDLMKPEEIGRIPYEKCLVMVYGEQPIFDYKFDYPKHKNYKYTQDFGADIGLGEQYMVFDRTPYSKEIGHVSPIDSNPKIPAKKCTSILPTIHLMNLDEAFFKKTLCRNDMNVQDMVDAMSNASGRAVGMLDEDNNYTDDADMFNISDSPIV